MIAVTEVSRQETGNSWDPRGISLTFQDFASVRWLGLFIVPVIGVWLYAARYAGRRFAEPSGDAGASRTSS